MLELNIATIIRRCMNPEDLKNEKDRVAKGEHTSRCYLMRKYQISDEDARAAMREITGDDRQSTMEE